MTHTNGHVAAAAAAASNNDASPLNKTDKDDEIIIKKKQQQNQNQVDKKKRSAAVQKAMWGQARQECFRLSIGAVALVASSSINQRVPKLMGQLMESPTAVAALEKSNATKTTTTTVHYFVMQIIWLGTLGGVASFVRTYTMASSQERIAARLRSQAFAALLTQHDLEWFQQTNHSSMEGITENEKQKNQEQDKNVKEEEEKKASTTSTLSSLSSTTPSTGMTPAAIGVILKDDVDTVAKTMTTTLANLLRSSSSCIFGTYHMLAINPQLVGVSLLVAPLVGAVALASRKYLSKLQNVQQQAAMKAASFVEERLNHIFLVKSSNRQDDEIRAYQEMQESVLLTTSNQVALANGWSMGILFSLGSSALCGILLQGRRAVQANKMTSGQLTSFGTYSFLLALGTAGVVRSLSEYRHGLQSGLRLHSLMMQQQDGDGADKIGDVADATETPKKETPTTTSLDTKIVQSLSMDHVDFSYQSHPTVKVLQDLSFRLSRGEVVALVGRNGSGKSTLASLLTGMYRSAKGNIQVHSKDNQLGFSLQDLDRTTQAQLVQVVPQQPVLFNMSILENVRYSRPEATEEQVLDALASAHGKDFVMNLEGQLQYQVGRNGCRLSGGQRQKIALARAFLANPVFLILDEPNSAMDTEAELALNDTLQACRQANRGLLIITHRAKTLEIVNRIVVLKEGRVVEEGTLAELQKQNNEFVALMPELE
jgi:ABC-type multidrug transport system fused ATPase/permease subunit